MTQYFWSSKILIILSAIKLHILKLIFRSYCKNHIMGSHILLNDTFDLHFCTLILFSVITLDFTTNFLSALKLQSGIVSFLFISYHDAITPGPSLSLAPPVSGGSNSSYTASNESHSMRNIINRILTLIMCKRTFKPRNTGEFVDLYFWDRIWF